MDFQGHFKDKHSKIGKTIGLFGKPLKASSKPSLLFVYNSFIRPYLDYGDIIYDKVYMLHFIKLKN